MRPEKPDLEAIFHAAQEIADASERTDFLRRTCAGDLELLGRLEALLAAADMETGFLNGPAVAAPGGEKRELESRPAPQASPAAGVSTLSEGPGAVIGPYKLLQRIGEGGFGVVYMAEQMRPVKRRVALKVIKAGMDTKAVIARFDAEGQALAMMEHPNIARVLDAGSTDSGRPYFVMELVKGIPITEFCDEAGYDTRRRLQLFVDVCHAVQHAHQKGVIHRDLKPSNVLVTLRDDRPVVKIIDFGIAKATEQRLTEKTLFTAFGQMVGTPVYMSPEQAVMSELDVDTRSDVYALGVLLYELLTGSTPIDPEELRSAGYDEIRRRIREDVPSKPSTKLSTMSPDVKLAVAARRHAHPNVLARECDGDLDWIVLKALEKERTRRYQSASAFADDIGRHLSSEPVSAVAPSRIYRLRKFAARNRVGVAAGVAVALALLAGTVISTWLALEARDAEGWASVRLQQVEKANDVLAAIFDNLSPEKVARNERRLQVVLAERLEQAVEAIDDDSVGDHLSVARLQRKLGRALRALGAAERSVPVLERALATQQRDPVAEAIDVSDTLLELAMSCDDTGDFERALLLKKRSLDLYERARDPDPDWILERKLHLALSYANLGRPEEALKLRQEVYDARKEALGVDNEATLRSESRLASSLWDLGEREKAIEHQEHVLQIYENDEEFGPDDPATWAELYKLAIWYRILGRPDEALELAERAWERTGGAFEKDHPLMIERQAFLAFVLSTRDGEERRERAVELGEDAYERVTAKHPGEPHHPLVMRVRRDLSTVYRVVGRLDEALSLAEENYRLTKHLPRHHYLRVSSPLDVADILLELKRPQEALPYAKESVVVHTDKFDKAHPKTVFAIYALGRTYRSARRLPEAIRHLKEAYDIRQSLQIPDEHNPSLIDCIDALASAYKAADRPKDAIPLLETAVDVVRAKEPPDADEILHRLHRAAGTCEFFGENERSAVIHEEMLVVLGKKHEDDPGHPDFSRCRECLLRLYGMLGREEKVRQVRRDILAVEEERLAAERKGAGPGGTPSHRTLAVVSLLQLQLEKWEDAETNARECWKIRSAEPELKTHWLTSNARSMLGAALLGQGKLDDDAEQHLVAGFEGLWAHRRIVPSKAHPRLFEALERLVRFYEQRSRDGDAERAERYRARLVKLPAELQEYRGES